MGKFARYLASTCAVALLPAATMAQEVSVATTDGSVRVVGNILSFDNEFIIIETVFGQLQMPRSNSICEGEACPPIGPQLEMTVSVDDEAVGSLMQSLIAGYASLEEISSSNPVNPLDNLVLTSLATGDDAGTVTFTRDAQPDGLNKLIEGSIGLSVSTSAVPIGVADNVLNSTGVNLLDPTNERVIALDALVPIVHPSNNVKSISLEELAQIAGGRITNWSQLGGDNAAINMILPPEDSAVDVALTELVLDPNRVRLRRTATRAADTNSILAAVQSDPNAISISTVQDSAAVAALPIRQTCGPLAHATDFAIKAEEYPLTKRVYAYTAQTQVATVDAGFLEYLTSNGAQQLIEAEGYINQDIELQPISLQGTRMNAAILSANSAANLALVQDLAFDLATAERLSTTFRFEVGSSDLDTKALADLDRMATFLNSPAARNRDILVIGFTDNVGRFDLNERLSLSRAASVSDALVASAGGEALLGRIDVSSYGPLAPVGCNDTAVGRESNRRVEIWLR